MNVLLPGGAKPGRVFRAAISGALQKMKHSMADNCSGSLNLSPIYILIGI